ncbi:MAG: BlaI/MecI/CopY family transcriptional regulator [Nanoarchaeota archaeon]|nr:BlaI/MecI/CopY family transcriptional regulator [Nanoarchaeota archaeon]
MKFAYLLLLFITILPLVQGALISDYLDDSGNLYEELSLAVNTTSLSLPSMAQGIAVQGSTYSLNDTILTLDDCALGCTVSFTIDDIVQKEGSAKSFSRNLKAFEPLTYEVYLPIGSIIDLSENSIVPAPSTLTSDGKNIIISWDINHTDIQRYYVKFSDHENEEAPLQEFKGEFNEWSVILLVVLGLAVGLAIGYTLKRGQSFMVVPEQLLSPDEKTLLDAINKHYETNQRLITQKDLGKQLEWSKSKVSGVMALLVQKKLVEKEKQGRNYTVKPLTKITKKEVKEQ